MGNRSKVVLVAVAHDGGGQTYDAGRDNTFIGFDWAGAQGGGGGSWIPRPVYESH